MHCIIYCLKEILVERDRNKGRAGKKLRQRGTEIKVERERNKGRAKDKYWKSEKGIKMD